MDITVRSLQTDADADAFRALNEEWITRYFALEDEDRRQLADPRAAYLGPGGEILIAELDGRPVGCVAIVPDGSGAWELGARSLFLGSSTKLANAVHLYETLGFRHVAPETLHMPYARADVFMRLVLAGDAA
jgi:putative acetyltransferase